MSGTAGVGYVSGTAGTGYNVRRELVYFFSSGYKEMRMLSPWLVVISTLWVEVVRIAPERGS